MSLHTDALRIQHLTDRSIWDAKLFVNGWNRSDYGSAKQIETGMLHIKGSTLMSDANAPFGGMKASGNSSSLGGSAMWKSSRHGAGPRRLDNHVQLGSHRHDLI
jgi:hypothetical protein